MLNPGADPHRGTFDVSKQRASKGTVTATKQLKERDAQVVANALTVYLVWRALDAARARGTLDEDEAESHRR